MRQIKPEMIAYLDKKLALNGLAQHAILEKDARTLFTEAARVCVGIKELTGNNDGPMVELIQETIGEAEGEAWCMSFVQTCLAYAEIKTGEKSPIPASEHCLTVWNETHSDFIVKRTPLPGAIAIWRHGTSQRGHTGVVLSCGEKEFTAVEGNTSNSIFGTIIRDGGGVYVTKRKRSTNTGSMRLVGFLKPF